MGVYINGMEMPTTCCHCPLMVYDPDIEWNDGGRETQGAYICVMTHELIDNTKREEHCPLVPVTEHGDLIDRDAFDERMRLAGGMCEEELTEDFKDGVQTTLYMLSNQPTVIPADVTDTNVGKKEKT